MKKFFSKLKNAKVVVALLLALGAASASGLYIARTSAVAACDWTNIVYCGLSSANASGLKSVYNAGKDSKGRTDIKKVMQWGGFNDSNIAGANSSNVKVGYLTRDGVIKVNGTTVGTGSVVTTRLYKQGRTQVLSGVYSRPSSQNQLTSEQVLVLFDSRGKATAALMVRCGNVLKFTPVKKPAITCNSLTATLATTGVERQYNFVAKATAYDTSIYRYYFDFGDGVTRYVTTNSSTANEQHQYAKYNTSFTAKVTVTTTAGVSATCQTTIKTPVQKVPKISISKTVTSARVEHAVVGVDTEYTYEVIVKNTGNVELKNAVVTDTPEAGVTLLPNQAVGTVANNTWTTTIASLAVGKSQTFTLKAKVPTYKAGTIKNTVCVDTPTISGKPDACDNATVEVEKPKVPHVSIDKVVNGKENIATTINTPFTYTLTVKNDGEVDLKDLAVTDTAPNGVEFISTDKGTIVNNVLNYTIPSLAIGQSATIQITAKATVYSSEAIKNTACVDTPTIPGSPDDCDDANITVPKPSISIDKVVNGKENIQVAVGEQFTYTLKVTNTGEVNLVNAVVTDPAPANIQFLSTDKGSIVNNALSYTIPNLAVNQSVTINITAKATTYVSNSIKNTACVDTPTVPGSPDDCDDATVTIEKPKVPGVKIEKVVNGKESLSTTINTPFTYTLKVTNTGEIDLANAVVTDSAPEGVQFVSTDKGTIVNNALSHTIPTLKVGESVTINITAKATTYSSTAIKNTACVDTPTVPGSPDDCDDANITVPKPNEVEVCDPSTGTIITVPETDKDKYEPKDSDKCTKIKVCVIADNTGNMVEITKDEFDSTKHSTNAADCVKTPVVPETPTVLPSTGPTEIIGSLAGAGALSYGGYTFAASRRALKNARK